MEQMQSLLETAPMWLWLTLGGILVTIIIWRVRKSKRKKSRFKDPSLLEKAQRAIGVSLGFILGLLSWAIVKPIASAGKKIKVKKDDLWNRVRNLKSSSKTMSLVLWIVLFVGGIHLLGIGIVFFFPENAEIPLATLGFLTAAILLSPIYAIQSAKASDNGRELLLIFVWRNANRLMQREKGMKPVDYIGIVPPGRTFRGVTADAEGHAANPDHQDYWELVEANGDSDVHTPTGVRIHKFAAIRMWVRYINLFVDVALVGVRGIYRIRTYPIEKTRYREEGDADKGPIVKVIPSTSIKDTTPEISNHVRTSPFRWPVHIQTTTSDRIRWDIVIVLYVRSVNPWLQFNNVENWSQYLTSSVTDSVVRALKRLETDDIIKLAEAGDDDRSDEGRDHIIKAVYRINKQVRRTAGIELYENDEKLDTSDNYTGAVQVLYNHARFRSEAEQSSFMEPWSAKQKAKAEVTLGEAEATRESTVVNEVAKAITENGEYGMFAARMQALEQVGANGNTILFETGGDDSRLDRLERLLTVQPHLPRSGKESENDTA